MGNHAAKEDGNIKIKEGFLLFQFSTGFQVKDMLTNINSL